MPHNAFKIAERMYKRAASAEPELRAAAVKGAEELEKRSKEILEREVYEVPVKKDPRTGKDQWFRTGDLQGSEHFSPVGINIRHSNDSGHARARYTYGTPQSAKQPVAKAPQQVSHWYTDAIRQLFGRTTQLRREAIQRALRGAGEGD